MLDIKNIIIFTKYLNHTNVFFPNSIVKLFKHTNINKNLINLIDDKQLPYSLIYSLRLIKYEILKTCITNNLANGFIKSFKLFANIPILFFYKKNVSFWLYINYWDLNNLTTKNWHLLPFIDKFFKYLGYAKYFI